MTSSINFILIVVYDYGVSSGFDGVVTEQAAEVMIQQQRWFLGGITGLMPVWISWCCQRISSLGHNCRDWRPPNLFSISISSLYVKEQSFIPTSQLASEQVILGTLVTQSKPSYVASCGLNKCVNFTDQHQNGAIEVSNCPSTKLSFVSEIKQTTVGNSFLLLLLFYSNTAH